MKSLAEDFGIFERAEITDFAVRMRVQVNGLLPLVKSSAIEYPNGDEVTSFFVYERIEKHCSKCFILDHEVKDCLVAKHQARELLQKEQSTNGSVMDNNMNADRSRPRDNSEAYRFTASRAEEAEHKDLHTSRYDMCRHDARHKIEERRRSRPDQDLSSRRVHKEPPRNWQTRRNRSPTSGSQIHIVAG
ncbi:unnamed protein product [Brassica oleracea]